MRRLLLAAVVLTAPLLAARWALADEPHFDGELRHLLLDEAGGVGGAPKGMLFLQPPGANAQMYSGDLGGGVTGLRLTVKAPGDALTCSTSIALNGRAFVKARVRVPEVTAGAGDWMGMNFELRARDTMGALVSPPGSMYTLIQNVRAADPGWVNIESKVAVPAGATTGEFCFRFVNSTGVLEVDELQIVAPKDPNAAVAASTPASSPAHAPTPAVAAPVAAPAPTYVAAAAAPAPTVTTHGAVTTAAVSTTPDGGIHVTADTPGSSVACGDWFATSGPVQVSGTLHLAAIAPEAPDWSGVTIEGYSQDATGRSLPVAGPPYTPIHTVVSSADGPLFSARYVPARTATRARFCVRFSASAGTADVAWAKAK
jgi:hypothetical protein